MTGVSEEWLCLNPTKGRRGEAGGQRDLSTRWEQQEPHDAEHEDCAGGTTSLHTGMCSLGLGTSSAGKDLVSHG